MPEKPQVTQSPVPVDLLDHFAGQAMNGIISACGDCDGGVDYVDAAVAKSSYEMADAMMRERERRAP